MIQALYDRLVQAACRDETVSYCELEQILKLDMDSPHDRRRIGEYLGEVSRHEVAQGRPMLSAVVLHKDGSTPGRGFYELAKELGLTGPDDELTFAVRQLKAVFDYWRGRCR